MNVDTQEASTDLSELYYEGNTQSKYLQPNNGDKSCHLNDSISSLLMIINKANVLEVLAHG